MRFTALDLVVAGLYLASVLLFSSGLFSLDKSVGSWLLSIFPDPEVAQFALNATLSGTFFVLALIAAWPTLRHNTVLYRTKPLLAVGMIPLALVAMVIATAALVLVTGVNPQTSVNQSELQALVQGLPPGAMVLLVVIAGPFVEEFLFRHLLIGKLSKYLNVWVCAAISVLAFAMLHLIGKETMSFAALSPYLGLGLVLVLAYVLCGKNLLLNYTLHLAKNLLALLVLYAAS